LGNKEYEKFKVKQDKMIVSEFDKFINETKLLEEDAKNN